MEKLFNQSGTKLSNSSVIRQKGGCQNVFARKQGTPNFSKNSMCMYMYMCLSGDKKCSFFRKCSVLCFLVTTVLRFVLLPYYRQIVENMLRSKKMVSLTTPPLLLKQNQLLLILFNDSMKQYKKINLTISHPHNKIRRNSVGECQS